MGAKIKRTLGFLLGGAFIYVAVITIGNLKKPHALGVRVSLDCKDWTQIEAEKRDLMSSSALIYVRPKVAGERTI